MGGGGGGVEKISILMGQMVLRIKSTLSQRFFKDFDERFLEHYWRLLRKYFSLCKGEMCTLKKVKGLEKALNQ